MMEFLQGDLWKRLRRMSVTCQRPAYVAVAYFGQGAARMLKLRKGSRLVVDASEHAVKCGLTHPADLAKMLRRGVRVYSVENLHAKVFVLGRRAFIGSNNVSRSSRDRLVEAAVVTTDPETVAAAREFVQELCLDQLGPETLNRLQRMYRQTPRTDGNGPPRSRRRKGTSPLPKTLLAQITAVNDVPEGSESAYEAGKKKARKRQEHPRKFTLDDFWQPDPCRYNVGEIVVQVVQEGDRRMVAPPGKVVQKEPWRYRGKPYKFVYVELPRRNRISLNRLAKRLGRGAKKRLLRNGRVQAEFARKLLAELGG